MKHISALTLFFILTLSLPIFAQPAWVRKQATPQENTLNDITRIPGTNKLIAVGEGSTVMISEDAGESWQIITNPAAMENDYMAKTVCFTNESTGFIGGSYNTILKTTDGGYTWNVKLIKDSIYKENCFGSIVFSNLLTGFAFNDDKLYRTLDGGENWDTILSDYYGFNNIAFTDNMNGYMVASSRFLKTTDGGLTWTEIEFPAGLPSGLGITEMYFLNDSVGLLSGYLSQTLKLFRTTDMGNSWIEVFSAEDIWSCHFANLDSQKALAACFTYPNVTLFIVTEDQGQTWILSNGLQGPFSATNAVCSTSDSTYISACKSPYNMYRSKDFGYSWEPIYKNEIPDFLKGSAFIGSLLFLYGDENNSGYTVPILSKSTDAGQSWTSNPIVDVSIKFIDFIGIDTAYICSFYSYNSCGFFKTFNCGLDWEEVSIVYTEFGTHMNFYNKDLGFISGYPMMRTLDGGLNWQDVSSQYHDFAFNLIDFVSADTIISSGFREDSAQVYMSYDKGENWTLKYIGQPDMPDALRVVSKDLIFAGVNNKIIRSTDCGNTWLECQVNCDHEFTIHDFNFPSPLIGYAVGEGQYETAFKTTDGGLTWNPMETNTTSALTSVQFMDNDHGFIFGNLGLMLETTTGGVADAKKPDKAAEQIYFTPQPNPFTDQLTLQFTADNNPGKCTLILTDLTGKIIKTISIGGKIDRLLLNLPDLSAGVYLLNLYKGNQLLQSEKVVKQ